MKKLPVLIATCVLGLWGCASSSGARTNNLSAAYQEFPNETDLARQSRIGAPTVYNGEATGGPGYTVTTGDGRTWAPEQAPGNTVTRTPSDLQRSLDRQDWQSEVIDEGPTDKVSQR
ncbi:hypothetical protein [Archangium sp.]|jgi:hypothetical protein|uniref:hypothetical protein n=1 Tax=Archangium sp. TaxID=1872627 RepID=UPI002EDA4D23